MSAGKFTIKPKSRSKSPGIKSTITPVLAATSHGSSEPSSPTGNSNNNEDKKISRKFSSVLVNGENLPKNNRLFAVIGAIEEAIAYIGLIKASYFSTSTTSGEKFEALASTKGYFNASLTHVQESLYDLILSLTTSNKNSQRYENNRFQADDKIKKLEAEIDTMEINMKSVKQIRFIPGTSELEASLFMARAMCRKIERQLIGLQDYSTPVIQFSDEGGCDYLNKLGDYFLAFAIYVLFLQSKMPVQIIKK